MKAWDSMESLAADMNISERTGWRMLKDGRVEKRKEDGQAIFVLVEPEPSDITDTLTTDTDVSSDMSENDFVSRRQLDISPGREGKRTRGMGPSIDLKKGEIELRRLDIESRRLEKIERKLEQKEEQEAEQERRRQEEQSLLRAQHEREERLSQPGSCIKY